MRKRILFFVTLFIFLISASVVFAESGDENEGDSVMLESVMQQHKVAEEKLPVEIKMWEKIEQEKPRPVLPEGKVRVREITVVGITALSPRQIRDIIGSFYNRDLSGKEMQRCADQITDWYNLNGFLSSYAYVEPARLNEGILEIKCVEGKVGKVEIKGNRYFSENVYRDRIELKEGDVFNIKLLKNNIYRINKHIDRKVTPNVVSSSTPGLTDIDLSVKDKLPFHFMSQIDNYGSEYILFTRYKGFLIFNNLTGHDDSLQYKIQLTEAGAHTLTDFDYFLPLNNTWKWEFYIMPYKKEVYYYATNEEMDFEKHAFKWYTYLYQTVKSEPNQELVLNYGLVYKFINWYAYGSRAAQDHFVAVLSGFDYVEKDDYGTWVFNEDLEKGIPKMWSASHNKDDRCSVKGSGSKYFKQKLAVARRQKLAWDTDFLFKVTGQYSTQALTGVNVFSVGGYMGVIDNRGYPRASLPADSGYYVMLGFAIPPYFLPKNYVLPATKTPVYNNLRIMPFYEIGVAYKRSPQTARDKTGGVDPETSGKTDDRKLGSLKSAGIGWSWNIPEQRLQMRMDVGFPLGHTLPKDGKRTHILYSITKMF
jgi:hemolysin activation/secretion protein